LSVLTVSNQVSAKTAELKKEKELV